MTERRVTLNNIVFLESELRTLVDACNAYTLDFPEVCGAIADFAEVVEYCLNDGNLPKDVTLQDYVSPIAYLTRENA